MLSEDYPKARQAILDALKKDGQLGKIRISTRSKGKHVEIRIQDTGTGIPPKIQNKVFDPFFTTKPVGKGTGQGLAIAFKAIHEKHGGVLKFETEENKGTTFIMTLPVTGTKSQPIGKA
ncbi:MAG: HAMP domain-containing histidine kinase [Desulfobacteraceae bacterium]|nr:HAMP domain-containing histidine kinase [Desulfobacteraceae bacterium]MBU4001525.1 HAMP domain-containing histidine kinase [Pseudomonadota bacterium]